MNKQALRCLERIVDQSGVARSIEAMLPTGVRRRQLSVKTLLLGMLICLADGRPAHLSRVHGALLSLDRDEQRHLGVLARWHSGEHLLTYRQVERTFGLVSAALSKDSPDGLPSVDLQEVMDRLLEASVTILGVPSSSSLAVDWSDYESFACPPRGQERRCADSEAAFGHRAANSFGAGEMFFGYYCQAATMVKDDGGGEVPELARRMTLSACDRDPPERIVGVIEQMALDDIALGDILADSGYAYREPKRFATPMRRMGAKLVIDLHPNDRGQKGTHMGAVIANGNLYCPACPKALFELSPLARGASGDEVAGHDHKTAELARYKLSSVSGPDGDGYRRVACPAVRGKCRCPLKPASLELSFARPTVAEPPEQPPTCCTQATITIAPEVLAKTHQKHDYPSQEHRRSYARRSAAERSFSKVKDPASNDISRGWCRLMGLAGIALFLACVFVVSNLRTADAFAARVAEDQRRRECGRPPKQRRKRRRRVAEPATLANAPPG